MKFRKKPVVEAWQIPLLGERSDAPAWVVDALVDLRLVMLPTGGAVVKTPEGELRGEVDDWLIRGVKGEIYPCKPDVFAATYERV